MMMCGMMILDCDFTIQYQSYYVVHSNLITLRLPCMSVHVGCVAVVSIVV